MPSLECASCEQITTLFEIIVPSIDARRLPERVRSQEILNLSPPEFQALSLECNQLLGTAYNLPPGARLGIFRGSCDLALKDFAWTSEMDLIVSRSILHAFRASGLDVSASPIELNGPEGVSDDFYICEFPVLDLVCEDYRDEMNISFCAVCNQMMGQGSVIMTKPPEYEFNQRVRAKVPSFFSIVDHPGAKFISDEMRAFLSNLNSPELAFSLGGRWINKCKRHA